MSNILSYAQHRQHALDEAVDFVLTRRDPWEAFYEDVVKLMAQNRLYLHDGVIRDRWAQAQ